MKTSYKNKYRSGIEEEISQQLTKAKVPFTYEKVKLKYKVPAEIRSYTPDFLITTSSGKEIFIEVKGIWVYTDRYKHLLVKQQHPELDIRFVFSNCKSKIRKGSSTSYADICEGNGRLPFKGVTWKYSNKTIPKEWLEE